MTSRRNFVIGAGTLLTGSGTFLGSGAFGVGAGDDPRNWVPVGVRTPPSEGLESSVGLQDQEGEGGDDSDGQQPDDPGDDDGDSGGEDDGDDPDGEDEDRDETDDGDSPDDDRDEDRDDGDRDDDDREESGAPSGETSIRLEVDDPDVLDSEHVLADDGGTLRGLRLEDLNMNALTYVGETADGRFPNPGAGDRVAFLVVNDGDTAVDLSVDVDGTAPGVLGFPAWVDAGVRGPRQRDLTSVAAEGLQPGGVVHVVVEVDTTRIEDVPPDAVEAVTFVADPV
jgi:hypothetical protein